MARTISWLWRVALWLIYQWWDAVVSAFFAALGFDITFDLNLIISDERLHDVPATALQHGPWILFLTAFLFLLRVVGREFWSHDALKKELEKAISHLASNNKLLRIHAIQDILAVSRANRRLHSRAMEALAQHLRECAPAEKEPGREIKLRKQRFGCPSAEVSQQLGDDIHKFAQLQMEYPRIALNDDAAAVVEAFANRRPFFDDPRRWYDLSFTDLTLGNFEEGNFSRFSFVGANLRYARFNKCNVKSTAFDGAILNDATFTGSKARGTSFSGCMAHRIHLDGSDLRDAKFVGTDLYDASLQKINATGATFLGAQMWRVAAGLANFQKANFLGANLCGADLHASKNLSEDQISGITGGKTDKNTRLPWSTPKSLRESGLIKLNNRPND